MDADASPLKDTMVFLVGARRSGTNWLQRALGAHPDVLVIPSETYVFSHGLRPLSERVQHGAAGLRRTGSIFMERSDFIDGSRAFCDRLFQGVRERSAPDALRIVERTPWHAYAVDLIADVYPDSWVLHIVRDGRDVARSLLAQPWGPDSMREAAEEWRESVKSARDARKPERYREVRYEELLADPRVQLLALTEWLGLSADPEGVQQMLAESGIQFNVDPSVRGVGTGKWRTLPPEQLAEFEAIAGRLNAELGYGGGGAPDPGEDPARQASRPSGGLRDRLGVARGRASRRLEKRAFEREVLGRLEAGAHVFERLLEGVHTDPDRLRELLTEQAEVGLIDDGSEWRARGPAAHERFLSTIAEDPIRGGRQTRGEVHHGIPTFAAVLSYELPDGSRTGRIVVARIRDDRVTSVFVYSFGEP
jgi:hypothetical protein